MPFQSEKQRRYLWANEPEIARDWTDTYGSRIEKNDGGISRIPLRRGGPQDWGAEAEAKQKGSANVSKDNPYSDAAQEENRRLNERVEASTTLRRLAEDKREEKVERFRNKQGVFKNPRTRNFWLDKALGSNKKYIQELTAKYGDFYNLDPSIQEDFYRDYLGARGSGTIDAYGNLIGGGGANDISYYPQDVHPGTGVTEVDEVAEVVEDVPSTYEGGVTMDQLTHPYYHETRIPRAFGGIMDSSTGRRGYFLGSIGKALGSVAKAAGKVFKSDIGKAAILGGLGIYGANAGWFGSGSGWFGKKGTLAPLFRKKLTEKLVKDGVTTAATYGGPSLAKLGVLTAPLLATTKLGDVPGDTTQEGFDHDLLRDQYAQEILRIKKEARERALDQNEWNYLGVPQEELTYPDYKDGGRTGYYAGGQSVPSDYTMEDAMMTTTQDKLGGITDVMKQADLYRQGSVGQFYAENGGSAKIDGDNISKILARVQELEDEGLDFGAAMAQVMKELSEGKAQGGRIGYDAGGLTGHPPITTGEIPIPPQAPALQAQRPNPMPAPQPNIMAGVHPMMGGRGMNPMMGGRGMNPMGGATPRVMAQEGGLMDLGGMEKDYRNDGGFVPIGGEEKADDVPARLSRNEFVFTADAVRGAGGGDIDKGAEIMENVMENLEQGGQISEESQGLTGAQEMFGVSERLSEVV